MRHLLPFIAVALLFVPTLSGCTGPSPPELRRDVPSAFPNHSVEEIRSRLLRAADTLRAFRAEARLQIDTPQRSGTYSAEIRHRRGGPLYLSISPGFGIEAVRVLVTQDSFFVYNRIQNRLTYGALDEAAARLPVPLPTKNSFETFLGLLVPPRGINWQLSADSSVYRLRAPDGSRAYTVDPAFWRVTHFVQRADAGTLIEARAYDVFGRFGGVVLPRRVVLRRPLEDARIALYYERLTLNPGELSFDLNVRENAERVPLS